MRVSDLLKIEGLELVNNITFDKQIKDFYISDMLTPLVKNVKDDGICLITLKNNINSLAAAYLLKMPCVIFCECDNVDEEVINKGNEKNIVIFKTNDSSFVLTKKLVKYE